MCQCTFAHFVNIQIIWGRATVCNPLKSFRDETQPDFTNQLRKTGNRICFYFHIRILQVICISRTHQNIGYHIM